MNPGRLLLTIAAILIVAGTYAQQINRADICQEIPGLSTDQQKKIDQLGKAHQKKMDQLRTRFYAETDQVDASGIKAEMNSEMKNHYQNISALLTQDQQLWFDQHCYADGNRRNLRQVSGSTYGRGYGRACGQGVGRGRGMGRGAGMGRGGGRGYGYPQN